MLIILQNHTYKYESEKICRIFFPTEKMIFASSGDVDDGKGDTVFTCIAEKDGGREFSCWARINGKSSESSEFAPYSELPDGFAEEKQLARVVVKVLSEITGIVPPWGILTGVRPSKLFRTYLEEYSEREAEDIFVSFFGVSPQKTALALDIASNQRDIIAASGPGDYSLYVSIPFCPTRCSYCSFVSHSIAQAKKLLPEYVRLLCEEIRLTAETASQAGLKLKTVYIGGGTPTSLDVKELESILSALDRYFDAGNSLEFTVEAGRPDTVTKEKLELIKAYGASRISINPQTFSDSVLNAIGRRHTASQTVEKFRLARETGFDDINMDLIAGLPTDTFDGFCGSLDRAVGLSPENITVHTLALKRSSDLAAAVKDADATGETQRMVSYSIGTLYENGYVPYYMYRQSKSAGNLENVGWTKPGRICLYNVYMMEEIHTVLACGGGAVTKLVSPDRKKIDRVYNFKYPYEYISRFEEMVSRKNGIKEFYGV